MNFAHRVSCGVVIILAGMPRSGSTWQEAMVLSALRTLGIRVEYSGYWDYARHVNMNRTEADSYYRTERAHASAWTPESVVVYKSHEFRWDLLHLCKRHIVFTSHRCLEHMIGSMIRAWNPGILTMWKTILNDYDTWLRHGAIDMVYDTAVTHSQHAAQKIGTALARMFHKNESEYTFAAIVNNANTFVRDTYVVSADEVSRIIRNITHHPNIPFCSNLSSPTSSSSGTPSTLRAAQRKDVEDVRI